MNWAVDHQQEREKEGVPEQKEEPGRQEHMCLCTGAPVAVNWVKASKYLPVRYRHCCQNAVSKLWAVVVEEEMENADKVTKRKGSKGALRMTISFFLVDVVENQSTSVKNEQTQKLTKVSDQSMC